MFEAVFSLSPSTTENTVSLASVYSPHRIRQIDSHGEGDNQGHFIEGDKDRQYTYNVIFRPIRATIIEDEKINISYYVCVFVDLCIQHAMPMCYIVNCGLSGSTVLFHFIPLKARFSNVTEHNMYAFIFSTSFV